MSATVRDRPVLSGTAGGGVAARRAVARWAWRLFRREWRQQILVLALLILTVAAAAFSVSAAYNVASLPGPQFGSANHLLQFDGSDPRVLAADIAAARKAFGTIQVIGRRLVPIPGSAQTVEFRAEDPHGPFSGPMIALTQGRYPSGAGQAAVTGQIAQTLQLRIGSRLSLGGHHQTVVGVVENPSDLSDQFVLVSASGADPPQSVTVLLNASSASFGAFRAGFRGPLVWQARGASTQGAVAGGVLGAVTVLLLLISLVAAAGFAVIAARRQRQLGMLAAIGATRKQLRMVMVVGGAVVGVIAAVAGTVVGLAAWIVAAPGLETFAGHRIDRLAIPWDLVALGMLLAVVTATAAAWWPARAASRLPVMLALSARPPRPRPAHRPAMLAAMMIVAGVVCLGLANQTRPPLIIAGALAITLGILFISPLAIRALAALGGRAPVAVRLALRDLGRQQARTGRPWPRSASPSVSPRRSSSARPPTRPSPMRATCRTPRSWSGSASQKAEMARLAGRPGQDARPARRPRRSSAPDRRTAASPRSYRPRHARQPRRQAAGRRAGQPDRTAGSYPGRTAEPGRRRPGRDLQHHSPVCRHRSRAPLPRDQLRQDHPVHRLPHCHGGAACGHHTLHLCDHHPRAADPGPVLRIRSQPRS